jgi:pilus assembly protein CpaC
MRQSAVIFRLFPALLVALTCALLSLPASAQIGSGINVEINKGTVIRLPGNASVVAVADPEIADVDVLAPNIVSLQGRGVGQTTVVAYNQAGDEILNETVTVSHNVEKLQTIIRSVMPEADVKFQSMGGALVVTGTVDSPLEADNVRRLVEPLLGENDSYVNMLTVEGSDQVLLKVRVAEVSRSELKRFGINLSSIISQGGQFAFGLVTGRDIGSGGVANIARGPDNNNIGVDFNSGSVDVNGVIDALAQDNVIKILAEPNLTTASGRTANFLAGGEFPIPVPGENGQVTIEWRQYGVALQFTPQVLSKKKISMTVAPEVSELSQIGAVNLQGFEIPSLTTRRAETTVELGSGQSFAIAGLLQSGNSTDVSKFPGLGDVPILGALFRSTEFQNDESELVIIITPYIVRGVAADQIADPTQGYIPPTDPERILEGNTYTPEKPAPDNYILEGSPRDMRRPKFRRNLAEQEAGKFRQREEMSTPAPPVAKTTPNDTTVAPVETNDAPVMNAPVPTQRPTNLNGPVGYMLR